MKSAALLLLTAGCLYQASAAPVPVEWPVDKYDVAWDSPSKDAKGSMPLGNGDIGLNVWVEPNGDLVMLVAKSDSFDEFNRLLKLGRIRVKTTPALVEAGGTFSQVLKLSDGAIEIKTATASVHVWVDANHPVAQVDITGAQPLDVQVTLEDWRKEKRQIAFRPEGFSMCYNWLDKYLVNPDTILPPRGTQIAWCHHNEESQWKRNLELTGLASEIPKGEDPVLDRAFGAVVRCASCTAVSNTELQTQKPVTDCSIRIFPLTQKAASAGAWLSAAEAKADAVGHLSAADRFEEHQAWWHAFWNRSWIDIDSKAGAADAVVSRGYTLHRFVLACAGRGGLPIKFNGSIFTVEGPDPDYRRWGGGYWWQNTRLPYWSMLYSGDYDMMQPLFSMYRNALPLREAATQAYYHHGGAFFPETIYFWGNYTDENYGFKRDGVEAGFVDNPFIRRYWQGGIELVAMMLDYYDATGDANFRDQTLLPIARDIVTFYDQHWKRGADGKIIFEPAQSLETWHVAKNPLPDIAGLRHIIPRLLELPVEDATRTQWRKTLADLPPTPMSNDQDGARLLPAETFAAKHNSENPELYAVFPYRQYTCLASPEDLKIGLNTWQHRLHHEDGGWQQNAIQAAMLGLASEAGAMEKARAASLPYRFPGFFGPNYDWTPDQDHPSVMLIALQRMLMQCEGNRIVLLPAWPTGWNASFKLHAPRNTTVEGRVENGKVTELKVTPESRRKDVELRSAADGQP